MGSQTTRDVGLLALRLAVGGTLMAHACQKLFGWFGGAGLVTTGEAFERLYGLYPGMRCALAAGASEILGGAGLLTGTLVPIAGPMAMGAMTVASAVQIENGFFARNSGIELPMNLAIAAGTLGLVGAGRFSVDAFLDEPFDSWRVPAGIFAGILAFCLIVKSSAARNAIVKTEKGPAESTLLE